jgi:hypothetical protein
VVPVKIVTLDCAQRLITTARELYVDDVPEWSFSLAKNTIVYMPLAWLLAGFAHILLGG